MKWVKKTLKMRSRSCLLGLARWERYARPGPWSFSVTSSWRRGRTAGRRGRSQWSFSVELLSDTPDGEVGQLVISSSSRVVWPGFDRDVEMTIWTLVKPMNDKRLYHADNMEVENENYLGAFPFSKPQWKVQRNQMLATPTFPDVPCVSSRVNQTWLMWANVGKQNKQWKVKVVLRGSVDCTLCRIFYHYIKCTLIHAGFNHRRNIA